jgi:tRNA A-37 threonylcarbamoyl transferase component Bud32
MQNNLLASGVYGCVFNPSYSCDGKKTNKKQLVSKLTKNDFTSKNEIEISNLIKKIPDYQKYFVTIEDSCSITRKNLKDSSMTNNCELLQKNIELNKKYVLLYANYIKSIELSEYLEVNKGITDNHIIRLFLKITRIIDLMYQHKIVHNDLHFGNIIYSIKTGNIFVIDFGLSISLEKYYKNSKLNYDYLKEVIFNYSPSWNWWTMEYHLLGYLVHIGSLNERVIRDTIDIYMENHRIIPFISDKFATKFKKNLIKYFMKYATMDREETIQELLNFSSTWDYYKISLHFLKLMKNFKIENDLLKICLIKLISPDPELRPNILEQHRLYEQLKSLTPIKKTSIPISTI